MIEFTDDGVDFDMDDSPNSYDPRDFIKKDSYESNESRNNRQLESVEKWRTNKGFGTLNLIMRFGKTRVAKMIYNKCLEKDKNLKTIILVPNDISRKNILTEFKESDNLKIYTLYQYVTHNFSWNTDYDLLIIDEIHKFFNDNKLNQIVNHVKAKYHLGLTGSKLSKEDINILKESKFPVIDTITEIEAIQNGWISPSVEYNLPVSLTDFDKERYATYSKRIQETIKLFSGIHNSVNNKLKGNIFESPFSLAMSCFVGKVYGNKQFIKPDNLRNIVADCAGWNRDMNIDSDYNKQINRFWNPDNIYERCKLFKEYIKNRNDILINNRPKVDKVMEILKYNNVPTICFNESIKMVDILSEQFPKDGISYHSTIESRFVWDKNIQDIIRTKDGRPKKIGKTGLKKLAIDGIKNGNYKYLFTAKSLNESLTIENIEQVITTGGSTDPNTHDQRVARGKTLDYSNPDKCCIIINLYVDDFEINGVTVHSRDKQKLIVRQSQSEINPIWIFDIKEIEID